MLRSRIRIWYNPFIPKRKDVPSPMKKPMQWMRVITALATLLVLSLLAWQCIDIYFSGNSPANLSESGVHMTPVFRFEDVSARLRAISPALTLYALIVLAALLMQAMGDMPKTYAPMDPENRLRLMKARVCVLPAAAKAEEQRRRRVSLIAGAAALACAACALSYLLNGANFTSWNLEAVMGDMLWHVAPWVLAAFAVMIAASHACLRSIEREIAALKGLTAAIKSTEPASPSRAVPLHGVRALLFALSILFIVLGVMNGGLRDVLVKAINICTECIGLG